MTVVICSTRMMARTTINGDASRHPKSKTHVKNSNLVEHHAVHSCFEDRIWVLDSVAHSCFENRVWVLDGEMNWLRLGLQKAAALK